MLKVNIKLAEDKQAEAFSYEVKKEKDKFFLNDNLFDWDMIQTSENNFHIIKNHQSYRVEILKADYTTKTFLLQINGAKYEIEAEDKFDLLLKKMGMDKTNAPKINEVKAPMPGLILDVKVTEGQEVKKGDVLLVLEAMKMENVLKSPADGNIKAIKVKKGENVEKNHVLIQFA